MTRTELEKALDSLGFGDFSVETDNNGQIIIYTGLMEDDAGKLVDFVESDND